MTKPSEFISVIRWLLAGVGFSWPTAGVIAGGWYILTGRVLLELETEGRLVGFVCLGFLLMVCGIIFVSYELDCQTKKDGGA